LLYIFEDLGVGILIFTFDNNYEDSQKKRTKIRRSFVIKYL